jgi:hypothetical protein
VCYSVEQLNSRWVVLVGGSKVLTCKSRRAALQAVRRAAVLLHEGAQSDSPDCGPQHRGAGDELADCPGLARRPG